MVEKDTKKRKIQIQTGEDDPGPADEQLQDGPMPEQTETAAEEEREHCRYKRYDKV